MRVSLVLTLLLSGCAGALAPVSPQPVQEALLNPDPVIDAERAFAARAGEIGWIPAFCEFSAGDGQLIGRAGLVNAHERLCALPDDGERNLYWTPSFAGIATSGDLGLTTGPASFDAARTPAIQYFTVWRQAPDGSWKWIYDGGPGPVAEPGPYIDTPQTLPTAAGGVGSAESAAQQVSELEIGAAATGALEDYLASDAHVYRRGAARAYGGPAARAAMLSPTPQVATRLVRVEASQAGDMVFTLGEAHWEDAAGTAQQGFFARIWQYRSSAWLVVYDQLVPWSPPAE
jgi:ketosteroid isomerase-like protein